FFHPSYVLRASPSCSLISFFLLHHPAPTHIYTLSLHDALPIFQCDLFIPDHRWFLLVSLFRPPQHRLNPAQDKRHGKGLDNIVRSEEHTSELQSRFDLVCRLLLEKKKKK